MRSRLRFAAAVVALVAVAFSGVQAKVIAEPSIQIKAEGLQLSIVDVSVEGEKKTRSTVAVGSKPLETPAHVHEANEVALELALSFDTPITSKPQQRLLTLTHSTRKSRAARFVGEVTTAKGGDSAKVVFVVTTEEIEDQVGSLGGEFDAEVAVADASFKNSYKFSVGKFAVTHAQKPDGSLAVDPAPDAREAKYEPKPEFDHLMRPADKRPPSIVSIVFAGATFFPLVLLVLVARQSGANLSKLPSVFMRALVFHTALAGVLGVVVYYWLSLPFLETLPILSGLSAFAALSGFHLLKGLCKEKAD